MFKAAQIVCKTIFLHNIFLTLFYLSFHPGDLQKHSWIEILKRKKEEEKKSVLFVLSFKTFAIESH